MNAGIAILGAAAGFIAYNELKGAKSSAAQTPKAPKSPFYQEWWNSGDEPATGNGPPTTVDNTGRDVAGVVNSVARFGTSLLEFIGAQSSSAEDPNTVNSGTIGSQNKLGSATSATEDDGGWNLPQF